MPRPGKAPGSNLDKPKNFKQTTKKLISKYLVKYRIQWSCGGGGRYGERPG